MSTQYNSITNNNNLLASQDLALSSACQKPNQAPRRLNPWPYLAAIILLLLTLSFNTSRTFKVDTHPFRIQLPNTEYAFSKEFVLSHNSRGTSVLGIEGGIKP